ncbi:type 2 GTP cyclohydrolase I [Candidatus Curculioniphilus buchneri]|uniref:type 2 GTP cyclohydrolase I n=1 Tax=Candidatus Curculioniphilus buchneri TaxID=690594 RepID=UPI00376EFE77
MHNIELENIVNKKLNSNTIKDYIPNGLQVEGRSEVKRILTGVTACQSLLDYALQYDVDAIIVHHGFFWKNETPLIHGMKRRRLKTLLKNDINLYAWHLPLDIHPELGNNAQLAATLDISIIGNLDALVPYGRLATPLSGTDLYSRLRKKLGYSVLHCGDNAPDLITSLAWCTGDGQKFIDIAAKSGMDAFIAGSVSEQTIHSAREQGLHFYAAGHHATECGGVRALGEWLSQQHNIDVIFIDVPNPA